MAHILPNPNLNFVPLDVLTAEELNQIVANINDLASLFPVETENIANGAVTATKIANGAIGTLALATQAVTNNKIAWGDAFPTAQTTGGTAALTTSFTSILSLNVAAFPAGAKMFVLGQIDFGAGGTDVATFGRLQYNGENSNQYSCTTSWARSVTIGWEFTKAEAQNYVRLQALKDNEVSASVDHCHMSAFRVG